MKNSNVAHNKFSAFISYKHVTSSGFAADLELVLKRYAKPPLALPRKIFRDEQHLSLGENLSESIRTALIESEYLILLASPKAAQSIWVRDEIEIWCGELSRVSNLIIILTAGDIRLTDDGKTIDWENTNALPSNLEQFLDSLPLWVDCSSFSKSVERSLGNPDYKSAINALVSRLEGVDPNVLIGKEWRIRKRNLRIAWTTALVLTALLVATAAIGFLLNESNSNLRDSILESNSRELAAKAKLERIPESLRLASEAVQKKPTNEALSSLLDELSSVKALNRIHLEGLGSISIFESVDDDNGIVFSSHKSKEMQFFDVETGHVTVVNVPDKTAIFDISVYQKEIFLLTESAVWRTRFPFSSFENLLDFNDSDNFTKFRVTDSGNTILLANSDGLIQIANVKTKEQEHLIHINTPVAEIEANKNWIVIVPSMSDETVRVLNRTTGIWSDRSRFPYSTNDVDLSPSGKSLAFALEDFQILVWDLEKENWIFQEDFQSNAVRVKYSNDGNLLAVGQSTGKITVFSGKGLNHADRAYSEDLVGIETDEIRSKLTLLEDGIVEDEINAISGSGHNIFWMDEKLFTANSNGFIMSWRPTEAGPLVKPLPNSKVISALDNQIIGVNNNSVWTRTGDQVSIRNEEFGEVLKLGKDTLLSKKDKEFFVHYASSGNNVLTRKLPVPAGEVFLNDFEVSENGHYVAMSWEVEAENGPNQILLWNAREQTFSWMNSGQNTSDTIAFWESSKLLAASKTGQITVWNITTSSPYKEIDDTIEFVIDDAAFQNTKTLIVADPLGWLQQRHLKDLQKIKNRALFSVGKVRQIYVLQNGSFVVSNFQGVKRFSHDFVYKGTLLSTESLTEFVDSISLKEDEELLLVTLTNDKAFMVPLDPESWVEKARWLSNDIPNLDITEVFEE